MLFFIQKRFEKQQLFADALFLSRRAYFIAYFLYSKVRISSIPQPGYVHSYINWQFFCYLKFDRRAKLLTQRIIAIYSHIQETSFFSNNGVHA
jgi:hypothetical protein